MAAFQPKALSPLHKDALRMVVAGLRGKQISELTGLSKWHLSRIRNSKRGREFTDELNRMVDQAAAKQIAASWIVQPLNASQNRRTKGA